MTRARVKSASGQKNTVNSAATGSPKAMLRPSGKLAALTSSALALPGIAGTAGADAPIEKTQASFSHSYYKEGDLPDHKADPSSEQERYEIHTEQLRFDIPVSDRIDVGVQFLYEEMSGASPWFVNLGPTGELLQVMSGATIEEERVDLTLDLDYYLDSGKDSFAWGFSKEKDYFSTHFSIGGDRNFNDKNTTLSVNGAFSYDWIDPTDADIFLTRPGHEEKFSIDGFLALSQILTRSTTAQVSVNYKYSEGYLSDPYKQIQNIGGGSGFFSDERPEEKHQVSLLARIRQHIEPANASIHLDYRFYVDTFKVNSHTIELAWYQSIFDLVTITPSVRYYSQSKAEFYEPILPIGILPKERSNDFRLSAFGAISTKLNVELSLLDLWQTLDIIASLSYERYLSDGSYALTTVSDRDEAPGIVNFQVFAGTVTIRF